MNKKHIIDSARSLPDKALAEILFRALFILARRNAATKEQIQTMLEIQAFLNPCLRVA